MLSEEKKGKREHNYVSKETIGREETGGIDEKSIDRERKRVQESEEEVDKEIDRR
jgi:hypothetical protein